MKIFFMDRPVVTWCMVLFIVLSLFEQVAWGEDWHCRNGQTYKNVRYIRHNLSAVQFSHSSGISIEKFSNLPDDIQARYGYDPQKEEQARIQHQKQLEEQKRKAQELQEEKERQEAQRKKEWEAEQAEIQKQKKYECIEVETDEFQGRTTVGLKDELELENSPSFSANLFFSENSKSIYMGLISIRPTSSGWRFLRSHQVFFLIDGERWQPKESYDSEVWTKSSTLYECISFSIPVERMEAIVHAESVRFQISGEEFSFSKDHQNKMSIFLEYLCEHYNMDEIAENQKKVLEFQKKTQAFRDLFSP